MRKFLYWLISYNFLFHFHILALKFSCTLSFQKCLFVFYRSLLVSKFLMHMLKLCLLLCSLVLISVGPMEHNNYLTLYYIKKVSEIPAWEKKCWGTRKWRAVVYLKLLDKLWKIKETLQEIVNRHIQNTNLSDTITLVLRHHINCDAHNTNDMIWYYMIRYYVTLR